MDPGFMMQVGQSQLITKTTKTENKNQDNQQLVESLDIMRNISAWFADMPPSKFRTFFWEKVKISERSET